MKAHSRSTVIWTSIVICAWTLDSNAVSITPTNLLKFIKTSQHCPHSLDTAGLFWATVFLLSWRYHMLTKLLSSPVPGSRKMEYKGNSWHETCFLCHRCQQPIGTKSFIPKDTGYFCVPCFEKQFAYQCCACKKVELQWSVSLGVLQSSPQILDAY